MNRNRLGERPGWHPEPCPMAWPAAVCNCVPCVMREITQILWVGLFSAWGEWPR